MYIHSTNTNQIKMKKLFYLLVVVVFISCGPQQNKNQDILPGRLGSENLALKNDKRLNPQLLSGLSEFGQRR